VKITHSLDEILDWARMHYNYFLRIQLERMDRGLFPSVREYRNLFGITNERLQKHNKEIIIMHPGPMNRGVEIDGGVADSEQAIILDQVLNGVATRMSVLYLLLGTKDGDMK
jgi:aspartate carbamoyltransferase catalytic subunit